VIESVLALDHFDAVAVLVSGLKILIYAQRLTRSQRSLLRPHLIAALGAGTQAVTIPAGQAEHMQCSPCLADISAIDRAS
jgi:hypothetical protein